MADLALTAQIRAARGKWRHRGEQRPDFAEGVNAGEESVWDFPRPPRIEPVGKVIRVAVERSAVAVVAGTTQSVRVVETAGAPTYYVPPGDVDTSVLTREADTLSCEWKGIAALFRVGGIKSAGWCYESTYPEFAAIRGWYSFHPSLLACYVAGERVKPQPGGYYGGWVTACLKGPIKGGPGTQHW